GTIGVIGVIAGVGMLFIRALRNESSEDVRHRRPAPPVAMALATVILVAILLGAGAATVIDSLTGFVQVRTWDRIVVVIAFAAFALTGFGCERVLRAIGARASDRRVRKAATVAMVLVLAGAGALDGGRPRLVTGTPIT